MASEWFVKTEKGAAGPFSPEQMMEFARAGKLRPATLVRKGADGAWRPAEQIRGLLSPSAKPQSPPQSLSVLGHRIDPTWALAAVIIAAGLLLSSCILVIGLRSDGQPDTAKTASSPTIVTSASDSANVEKSTEGSVAKPSISEVTVPATPMEKAEISNEGEAPAALTSDAQTDTPTPAKQEESVESRRSAPLPENVVKSGSLSPPQPIASDEQTLPSPRHAEPRSVAEVIADVEPSVALIEGDQSSGTGFVVETGIVLTNKHVLQTECVHDLRVYFPSAADEFQRPQSVRLLYKDPKRDLAYLQVKNTPPPLRLTADHAFKRGQEVTVVGNPGMTDGKLLVNAVSRGVMSTEVTIKGSLYFQLGISINPGNSGGPVLGSDGSVIGVVTLKDPKKEGMGFCIPPKEVGESIAEMKLVPEEQIPQINDDHDLQVVLLNVGVRGVMAKVRMDSLVAAMTRAIDSGGTANDGVETVRQQSGLNITSPEQTRSMQAAVTRIVRNSRYPEQTRQQLADLWATVQSMVSYAQEPRGSLRTYQEKALELDDDFDRQFQRLRVLIGSPFE